MNIDAHILCRPEIVASGAGEPTSITLVVSSWSVPILGAVGQGIKVSEDIGSKISHFMNMNNLFACHCVMLRILNGCIQVVECYIFYRFYAKCKSKHQLISE